MEEWCFMSKECKEKYDWERLFSIAKKAILTYMNERKHIHPPCGEGERKATFVTLEIEGKLRGCIGSIIPRQCLERDVAVNAVNAAFFDPRFFPLQKDELGKLEITISILSPLQRFRGEEEEWLNFLQKEKPGVFIKTRDGEYSATFLPEVWKHFQNEKDFMEALSLKASLPKEGWKSAEWYYYYVDSCTKKFRDIE